MTMIILEGCDANFKTTIANKLSKELGYDIVKGSTFEYAANGNEELYKRMISLCELDNVILDRFIYSNLVYAPLYDDFSMLTPEQVEIIENKIEDKAIIFYLHASVETIVERINVRGDEYVKVDKIESIINGYDVLCDTTVELHTFNTKLNSSDNIVKSIIKIINCKN